MNVQVIQHVPFEGLGSIGAWLEKHSATVSFARLYESPTLPTRNGIDLAIVLGGPMSVNDEVSLPWLRREKQFIREVVDHHIPLLGICLGAQLIASALGARVYRNPYREIGWYPVEATPASGDVFQFPPSFGAFHWHGEALELPPGAVRLARSAACDNQAFQIGRHVIGLQCHLETTPESATALLDNCGDDLVPGPYVQGSDAMRAVPAAEYARSNALMSRILSYLTGVQA